MNKHFIKALHTLTGKVEQLQQRARKYAEASDDARRVYESISDAKRGLIAAIMHAESASQPTEPTMETHFEQAATEQQEAQNGV